MIIVFRRRLFDIILKKRMKIMTSFKKNAEIGDLYKKCEVRLREYPAASR